MLTKTLRSHTAQKGAMWSPIKDGVRTHTIQCTQPPPFEFQGQFSGVFFSDTSRCFWVEIVFWMFVIFWFFRLKWCLEYRFLFMCGWTPWRVCVDGVPCLGTATLTSFTVSLEILPHQEADFPSLHQCLPRSILYRESPTAHSVKPWWSLYTQMWP